MNHVHLSQATVGLWVDSVAPGADYALRLRNSIVTKAESIGILSQSGHIVGYNNLFSDCGQACGHFALGGDANAPLDVCQLRFRIWGHSAIPDTLLERLVRSRRRFLANQAIFWQQRVAQLHCLRQQRWIDRFQ